MSEAVPQAASGMADGVHELGAVSEELRALRLAWGDTFMFGHDELGYWASWLHRPGTAILRGETSRELGGKCAAAFDADCASPDQSDAGAAEAGVVPGAGERP